MAARDGDGWAICEQGHRHWGVYGASGLLIVHRADDGVPYILMQRRSWWSHHGGTWGLPGGARDSHESVVDTALREAWEEASIEASLLGVQGVFHDDHGGWTFSTVIASIDERLRARPANGESAALEWVAFDEVAGLRLHPGFKVSWPSVSAGLEPQLVVLDAANIVGARADGWWKDRKGATQRLIDEVAGLMSYGWHPQPDMATPLNLWFPRVVVVVEGAARGVEPRPGVEVIDAPRSGDDAIVAVVHARASWERALVITADRELRSRVSAEGASVVGPRWLLDLLSRSSG